MKSIGKTAEDLGGANQPVLYFSAAILQLLIASVLAAAIGWADAHSVGGGILVGAILWVGLGAPIVGGADIVVRITQPYEPRDLRPSNVDRARRHGRDYRRLALGARR